MRPALCHVAPPSTRRGHGITVAATPDHGTVVVQARELVRLARRHGYRRDELIRIIEIVD